MYKDELWAKLATLAGFVPYNTETSARRAFGFMEDFYTLVKDITEMDTDGDGDVLLGCNEFGYNPIVERCRKLMHLTPLLCIEVFPMDIEGALAEFHDDVDHWDILVRPEGGDPFKEYEDLTRDEAEAKCLELENWCPGITADWQLEDLLR